MKRATRIERREEKARISRINEQNRQTEANKFMGEAIKQAKAAAEKGEIPIGCVIVKDGKIISRGQNLRETKKDATAHAEIIAIKKACKKLDDWRLNGAEIYVTLEPCPMCAGAIMNSRVSKIYFGAYEKKSGSCGSAYDITGNTSLNSRAEVHGGIMEEECSSLLTDFFKTRRETR